MHEVEELMGRGLGLIGGHMERGLDDGGARDVGCVLVDGDHMDHISV